MNLELGKRPSIALYMSKKSRCASMHPLTSTSLWVTNAAIFSAWRTSVCAIVLVNPSICIRSPYPFLILAKASPKDLEFA